ncbi:saccharopine dehydrogenase NADP-binding domain-containing protein [Endozoicomonas sp. Mp262]|uniref:saccharopine dehydrogenase family protein n=1 Tax=Endozoicomonas sp. Mp262 TaxID=2919499 RepID=UPI0021DB0932
MNSSNYDLVVFGATSFVGKILTRYLLEYFSNGSDNCKWAIAGRSQDKLEKLKRKLGDSAKELPILIADAKDETSLKALCNQTRVIISTVGPYALYGEPLIKACVETGTDYCDLTGEVQWIKQMIEFYQGEAKESGARIVHCCGFDSVPSDLGVYFLQQYALNAFKEPCTTIKMRVKKLKGGFSGGTAASIVNIVKEASKSPQLRKDLANPFVLCPEGHRYSAMQFNIKSPRYDDDFKSWSAPFIMSGINTRIVHRSNALANNLYGGNFKYDEAMLTGRGLRGKKNAALLTTGLTALMVGAAIKPSRWALKKFILPKPGEGPSPRKQAKGFYDLHFLGSTESGKTVYTRVTGDRDPGYGSTAKILGQAAICLAYDIAKSDQPGGFWTPATLFGHKLIDRLTEYAGLTFQIMANSD